MKFNEVIGTTGRITSFVGAALDGINKLGQNDLLHYPLGRNNIIENHIGNFGSSLFLTMVAHEILRSIGVSKTYSNLVSIGLVAGINIFVETVLAPVTPNPELVGDVLMGIVASGLTLMALSDIEVIQRIRNVTPQWQGKK